MLTKSKVLVWHHRGVDPQLTCAYIIMHNHLIDISYLLYLHYQYHAYSVNKPSRGTKIRYDSQILLYH